MKQQDNDRSIFTRGRKFVIQTAKIIFVYKSVTQITYLLFLVYICIFAEILSDT